MSNSSTSHRPVKDWVDSNFFEHDAPKPHERITVHESSRTLRDGCEVSELHSVPAELMDLFRK